MINQQKDGEDEEEKVCAIRIAYLLSWEGCCLILEFVLDFRKDNLVILVIKSFFPYRRPILLDFQNDNLMILVNKYLFPYHIPILSC